MSLQQVQMKYDAPPIIQIQWKLSIIALHIAISKKTA
jgi:hypothetical protein